VKDLYSDMNLSGIGVLRLRVRRSANTAERKTAADAPLRMTIREDGRKRQERKAKAKRQKRRARGRERMSKNEKPTAKSQKRSAPSY
jgi:hypothetical protein